MNKIILMGRITKDIELHQTQSGTPVCTMTLAVKRDFGDGVDFINCTLWNKTAELAAKYLGKGRNVLIDGNLQSRKFKDKNGVERTAWEVQVEHLHFVDRGEKKAADETAPADFEEVDDSGTLPF